jgi:predicted DNA-binding transcriptional regulator AlpA
MKRFLNEHEVANLMGIKVRTLQKWRQRDIGPRFRRLGKAIRYDLSDVESWIAAAPTGGGRPPGNGRPEGA